MPQDRNFDPYYDWDSLDDKMIKDLRDLVIRYRAAQKSIIMEPSKGSAKDLLECQLALSETANEIYRAMWTEPVMVHVAGPKKEEEEDGDTVSIQRCKRCGSMLQAWKEGMVALLPTGPQEIDEESIPWWDEGDVVAKAVDHNHATMYQIPSDKKLDKHEMPCPDFATELMK